MIRKLFFSIVFLCSVSTAFAAVDGRYRYDSRDKVMVDTQTGKVYGFIALADDVIPTEIDYVNGTVRPLKSFRTDDKSIEDEYNRVKRSDSFINWVQKIRKILPGWPQRA